jgi:hypothetical protein
MVIDFVSNLEGDEIKKLVPKNRALAFSVYENAKNHFDREAAMFLLKKQRPNESKGVQNYREANYRHITQEVPSKWLSKSSRIVRQRALSFDTIEMSEILKERLSQDDYDYNGQKLSFEQWLFKLVLPYSAKDSNGVAFEYVYNHIDASLPPDEVNDSSTPIYSKTYIVPFDDIIISTNGLFVCKWGEMTVKKGRKEPFYMMADKEAYFRYLPKLDSNNKLNYELEFWYQHNLNDLPISHFPSVIKEENKVLYRDSYLAPAFPWLDEAINSFSNDQGVATLHNNPILVIGDIDCSDCGGEGKIMDVHTKAKHACGTCNGSGKLKRTGSHEVMQVSRQSDPEQKINAEVFYVNPEVRVLEHSAARWDKMLERARKAIYLDMLEGTGTESGVAKGLRLEGLKDLMKQFGDDVIDFVVNILHIKEMLYVVEESQRFYVSITKPTSYEVETEEMLLENVKSALVADRQLAQMAYIKQKYRGDEVRIKAYDLAFNWCPLLLVSEIAELQFLINSTAYSPIDLRKREVAVAIFEEVVMRLGMGATMDQYFALADEFARDLGIFEQTEPLFQFG